MSIWGRVKLAASGVKEAVRAFRRSKKRRRDKPRQLARLSHSATKRGSGRVHTPGPTRRSIAWMPEFGTDKRGTPIPSLPLKYMHAYRRRWAEYYRS